jgi:hypothetical protein
MNNEKTSQSIDQAFNQSLNKSLGLIDEQTQNELLSIRRRVLQAAQEETAVDVNHIAQNNTAVLSVHTLWRNKKITSIGLGFALAASFMLVVLIPNMQKNTSQDFSTDFALYTEVDPDWLADMDIAYALGDE